MKKLVSVLLAMLLVLTAFSALAEDQDLNSYTLDEIIAKAKE